MKCCEYAKLLRRCDGLLFAQQDFPISAHQCPDSVFFNQNKATKAIDIQILYIIIS